MQIDPLLYRFGFACVAESNTPSTDMWNAIRSEWEVTRIRDLLVLTHPETPVAPISDSALLIGHAFAIGNNRSAQEIIATAIADDSELALHEALDDLSGRFVLITSYGGGRVYHDAVGSRSVFYHLNQPLCIASHDELIAELVDATVDPLAQALRDEPEHHHRGVVYLPGDLSMHGGIRALLPNHFYDISTGETVRYWPRSPREQTTLDQFYSAADAYFDGFASHLANGFTPILSLTGGVDSRLLVAALKKRSLQVKYVTWADQGVPDHELPRITELSSYLEGEHKFIRATANSDDVSFSHIKDVSAKGAGHFTRPSPRTANMSRIYNGQPSPVFIPGLAGEIVRGFYNTSKRPIESASVAELVRAYSTRLSFAPPSDRYLKLVSQAVERSMLHAEYEGLEKYGYDVNDLYYWESRVGMWASSTLNKMDPAMLSMTGFNNRRLFANAFGLQPENRLNKDLFLKLIRRYDAGLANIQLAESIDPAKRLERRLESQREKNASLSAELERRERIINELHAERREKDLELNKLKEERAQAEHPYPDTQHNRDWQSKLPIRKLLNTLKRAAQR